MSTSIILLDRNSNANDVDIMAFEPCVLVPPCGRLGGIEHMVPMLFTTTFTRTKKIMLFARTTFVGTKTSKLN